MFGFPAGAALFEDTVEQLCAGFLWLIFVTPLRSQRTFNRRLEQGLTVLREFALCRFQFRHTGIEVGQQFFQLGDDAGLFGTRREQNMKLPEFLKSNPWPVAFILRTCELDKVTGGDSPKQETRIYSAHLRKDDEFSRRQSIYRSKQHFVQIWA